MYRKNESFIPLDSTQLTPQEKKEIDSLLNNLLPQNPEEEISSEKITRKICRDKLDKLLELSKE